MRVGFYTLGCKLNQCETEAMADAFVAKGHVVVGLEEPADLYFINTCTVTSKSEQKARRVIRKILSERETSPVVVTGCYAEVEREELQALGKRVVVVGLDEKDRILDLPRLLAEAGPDFRFSPGLEDSLSAEEFPALPGRRFRFRAARFSFHTRAFLKIQDGCDNRCSYCRVRIARGPSVSLDAAEVVSRFRALEEAGYAEIVLTGVNVSSYRSGNRNLSGLLSDLIGTGGKARIRLSSLEPDSISPDLTRTLADPRICPHFHLPLQSGSDPVLARMARRYRSKDVASAVDLLREAKPDPYIAADLITGFPGETDEDQKTTLRLVEELDFSDLHVFPFSPRPGTAAYSMKPKVPERISGERAAAIREYAEVSLSRYLRRQVGKVLDSIGEEYDEKLGSWMFLSDNYLPVLLLSGEDGWVQDFRGARRCLRVLEYRDGYLFGLLA